MSHWRHTMVDGAKFWIICNWLKLLRKAGRLQLIQNSAPSCGVNVTSELATYFSICVSCLWPACFGCYPFCPAIQECIDLINFETKKTWYVYLMYNTMQQFYLCMYYIHFLVKKRSDVNIVTKHWFPNMIAYLTVQCTLHLIKVGVSTMCLLFM